MTSMTELEYFRLLSETAIEDDEDEIPLLLNKASYKADKLVAKGAIILGKQVASAKVERNPEKKVKKLKQCLRDAKLLRAEAKKIPPDDIGDHTWRMISQPLWITGIEYASAAVRNKDVKNINKNETIQEFDDIIKYLEKAIPKAEEKAAKAKEKSKK